MNQRWYLTWKGRTQSLADWAREVDLPYSAIYMRIKSGWDIERALTTPVRQEHTIEVAGQTHTTSEWSKITGLPRSTIYDHLRHNSSEALILKAIESKRPMGKKDFREELFSFIVRYKQDHDGIAPSLREIQQALPSSPSFSRIRWALAELQNKGKIRFQFSQPRTIQVTGGKWTYQEEQGE